MPFFYLPSRLVATDNSLFVLTAHHCYNNRSVIVCLQNIFYEALLNTIFLCKGSPAVLDKGALPDLLAKIENKLGAGLP
jgi:hypothetical protein